MSYTRESGWSGLDVVVVFLVFATFMAGFVGLAVLFPGRLLDAMWRLNPDGRAAFQSMGKLASLLLFAVAAIAGGAAIGIRRRRKFGWWLAVFLFSANGLGDAISIVMQGRIWQGGAGVFIAGLFLIYLAQPRVRAEFKPAN